jgi:hypothetical protein
MRSSEDLFTIDKKNCQKCGLKEREIEAILVPPPKEILGIIISRDPTVDWLYYNLNKEPDINCRRKMLFASAIPLDLMTKLLIFMRGMRGEIDEKDKERLFDVIFQKVYWTHLHKCPTDSKDKESKFTPTNAKECANTWLEKELNYAIGSKTKFIITLGDDVRKWIEKEWKGNENNDIELIHLPHPSGQNNPIWYRSTKDNYRRNIKETEDGIKRLMELCKVN